MFRTSVSRLVLVLFVLSRVFGTRHRAFRWKVSSLRSGLSGVSSCGWKVEMPVGLSELSAQVEVVV